MVEILRSFIEQRMPHNKLIGMRLLAVGPGEVTCTVPHGEDLAGDPDAGVLHRGVIISLMDVACGGAVCMRLGRLQPIATIDLRLDSIRTPGPRQSVTARAECYEIVGSLAFVRALAYEGDSRRTVAAAQATFMVSGS